MGAVVYEMTKRVTHFDQGKIWQIDPERREPP
jgi:hypothetical protein